MSDIPKITARHLTATDRIEAKLTSIMREIDGLPTRFHLKAVVVAASAFWVLVGGVTVAFMK